MLVSQALSVTMSIHVDGCWYKILLTSVQISTLVNWSLMTFVELSRADLFFGENEMDFASCLFVYLFVCAIMRCCFFDGIVLGFRNVDPPIWYDTNVRLFEIQRV